MAVHITSPALVAKIERLARATGLSEAAAIEKAVDSLLAHRPEDANECTAIDARMWERMDAILAELDRIPEKATPIDPLEWDEYGLLTLTIASGTAPAP